MKIEQKQWTQEAGWRPGKGAVNEKAQMVLAFGSTDILKERNNVTQDIHKNYPNAVILGCSTAGEIYGTQVSDDTLAVTAIQFEHSRVVPVSETVQTANDSFAVGERLARALEKDGLAHVFVLSDGLNINGSDLVLGMTEQLPGNIAVTGGLSGDGGRFQETYVFSNGRAQQKVVTAVGFYGDRLKIGYGSLGGWDPFGPERIVTRAQGNVLFELDGKPALELYKQYLGEHAQGLPATGLYFPLSVRMQDGSSVVRTILAVDEAEQSMTFAGNVPEGSHAKLMKANFDRLIDGAAGAAQASYFSLGSISPDLAILISCVGRKLILKQRTEEEVEGVRNILGEKTALTGFYSYGEISPVVSEGKCGLHNQTMTITAIVEK